MSWLSRKLGRMKSAGRVRQVAAHDVVEPARRQRPERERPAQGLQQEEVETAVHPALVGQLHRRRLDHLADASRCPARRPASPPGTPSRTRATDPARSRAGSRRPRAGASARPPRSSPRRAPGSSLSICGWSSTPKNDRYSSGQSVKVNQRASAASRSRCAATNAGCADDTWLTTKSSRMRMPAGVGSLDQLDAGPPRSRGAARPSDSRSRRSRGATGWGRSATARCRSPRGRRCGRAARSRRAGCRRRTRRGVDGSANGTPPVVAKRSTKTW